MELQCRKSTFVNKLDKKYAIGIPINSMDRSPRGLLTDPASQFSVMPSPSNQYFNIRHSKFFFIRFFSHYELNKNSQFH